MAVIQPFRALRYTRAAGPFEKLVAPPYDVIDAAERSRLAAQCAANAIHLILPAGDQPYAAAAALLERWRADGWLAVDSEPAMFLYAQRFAVHGEAAERWGILAALRLESLDSGVVLPHERTLAAPKADRLHLIRACRTNLSPIFGLVDAPLGLGVLGGRGEPLAEFTDRVGTTHRLWRLTDPAVVEALAARIAAQQVFIADGHHRYETALAYRDERRAAEAAPAGPHAYDFVLAYLCSTRDPGLVVLPTHRLLAELTDETALLARWRSELRVEAFADPAGLARAVASPGGGCPRVGVVGRTGPPWLLEAYPDSDAARRLATLPVPLGSLDVSLLHQVVLPGVLADRFAYTHDAGEALHAVASGAAALAALVPPPRVEDVLAISRAGLTMPQKSTYFHPKVPTGLAFHPLDG